MKSTIRIDFDQMKQISRKWNALAEAIQYEQKNLEDKINILKNGDWIGASAEKFYFETDTIILPAFDRL